MEKDNSLDLQKQQEAMDSVETILRLVLDSDAKLRLNNIRVVNPDMYYKVASIIVNMYNSGRVVTKINEDVLRQILAKVHSTKREITITRR